MTQMNLPGSITCPHCGQTYAIAAEQWPLYVGRSIACTKCGQVFAVSGGGSPAAPPPMPPALPQGYPPQGAYPQMGYPQQGYAPPPRKGLGGGAIAAIVIGALCVLAIPCVISLFLPAFGHAREAAIRVKCAANLKEIGRAVSMYTFTSKGGEFPDSMARLVETQGLSGTFLVCPDSSDTPLLNTGPNLTDAQLVGHYSYVYVGKGWTNMTAGANTVVAYEPLSNHHSKGMNVLYGDFHVEWIDAQSAQNLIRHLPPPPPAMRSGGSP